ncbi:MAG: TolC family protein, partial [Nitrospinales bacterium]
DFRATFKWFDNNGIPQDEGFGILVGARIPLWLGKNRSRVAEAQHNLRALEFEKKDLQNQAFAEINKIYFKIQNPRHGNPSKSPKTGTSRTEAVLRGSWRQDPFG